MKEGQSDGSDHHQHQVIRYYNTTAIDICGRKIISKPTLLAIKTINNNSSDPDSLLKPSDQDYHHPRHLFATFSPCQT